MPRVVVSSTDKSPKRASLLLSRLAGGRAGLQGQRMQLVAHAPLQAFIDHLMLLNPAFAAKALIDHMRCIMITVARQILDPHFGAGLSTAVPERW